MGQKNVKKGILVFVRYALAITFLSAVADRFGFWGAPGAENVAWGSWSNFLEYTALLNPWAPERFVPVLGGGADRPAEWAGYLRLRFEWVIGVPAFSCPFSLSD